MENSKKIIDAIAKFLTDDPDIFNETVSLGGIAAGVDHALRTRKHKKKKSKDDDDEGIKKHFHADPVTGKPKNGEVLYSDTQSEDTDDAVD